MDWDEEYDLLNTGGGTAGPSFIDRARNAPADEDDDDFDPRPAVDLLVPAEPETPLEQLIRHWTNERHCPDILPAQETLLGNLLDHLRRQVGGFQFISGTRANLWLSVASQKRCSSFVETHRSQKRSTSGLCSLRPRSSG